MVLFHFKFIIRRLSAHFGVPQRTPRTFFFYDKGHRGLSFHDKGHPGLSFRDKGHRDIFFHDKGPTTTRSRSTQGTSDTWETSVGSAWDQRQAIRWRRQTLRMHRQTSRNNLIIIDSVCFFEAD